jgi:hypothetical protein
VHDPRRGSQMDASVSSMVEIAGREGLDPLPCYLNLQQVRAETPFLTSNIEARPAPLLVMAKNGDDDKHCWGEGPSHNGRWPPSHRVRLDIGLDWTSSSTRWGSILYRWLHGLASCRGTNHRLLVGVGLLLLWM